MKLKIVNLDGVYFDGEVKLVNLFTTAGNITVLKDHIPLISAITISHLYTIDEDGNKVNYAIAGGTLFVSESECKIITSAIEREDEIDKQRAEDAKERAEKRIHSTSPDVDIKRAEVALKKSINRLSF